MPKYHVTVVLAQERVYEVEADNEAEARRWPTEWIKIDKMPRTGGPYICAWFFIDGGIGSCCVIARSEREPHLWLCSSNDTLATDKDIAEGGFTHYAVLTLPNQ